MSKQEQFDQMRAALQNILDISSCDFARHQAAWGLGLQEATKTKESAGEGK